MDSLERRVEQLEVRHALALENPDPPEERITFRFVYDRHVVDPGDGRLIAVPGKAEEIAEWEIGPYGQRFLSEGVWRRFRQAHPADSYEGKRMHAEQRCQHFREKDGD